MNVLASFVDALDSASERLGQLDGRFLLLALALHLSTLGLRALAWRGVLLAAYPGRRISAVSVGMAYAAGVALNAFMGLARLRELADGLVRAGMSPDTPAAVVSRGTLPDQEVATATLDTIADAAEGLPAPALVVVGDVVGLAPRLRRRSPAALLA